MINSLSSKIFQIKLFPLLIFVFLWSYGFTGFFTKLSSNLHIVTLGILLGILVFLFFVYEKYVVKNNGIDSIKVKQSDIKIILFIFLGLVLVGYQYLFYSIDGDELFHAYTSHKNYIYALILLSSKLPSFFLNQPFWIVVWIVSICIFLGTFFLLYVINKIKLKYKYLILCILILIAFRAFFIIFGGDDPSHPPFRLFPLWLSSVIFSPSNFAFRLPGIFALSLIGFLIYKVLKSQIDSPFVLFLSVFTLLSIPLLWNTAYIVEPSIWAALFSIFFLLMVQVGKFTSLSFFTWFSLLAIFILTRQSLVFLVLPLMFLFVLDRKDKLWKNWKETIFILSPLLIVFVLLFRSFIFGTPAQGDVGTSSQLSLLEKLSYVITSGLFKEILVKDFGVWAIFIIFAFVPTKKNGLKYFLTVVLFSFSSFIVFYSITPNLWGISRYQSEYIVPLIVLGVTRILVFVLKKDNKIIKLVSILGLIGLFIYNIYTILLTPSKNDMINGHTAIVSHPVYDYKTAFIEAKKSGYAGHTATLGITYGIMNEVLYGYTLDEIKKQLVFHKKHTYVDPNVSELISNQNIRLILISDIGKEKKNIYNELITNGFSEWKRFSNENTTDDIIALKRNKIEEK